MSWVLHGQQTSQPSRITAGAWLPFNISARFEGTGAFPAQSNPGPFAGSAVNREYDDGYARVDSDGNAMGVTWNWGYRDATQVPGNDTLRMHGASAAGEGRSSADADNPSLGFEIAYQRDLHRSDKWAWGFRVSFGYADIGIKDNQTVFSAIQQLTDVYALNGIVPPGDPSLPGWQYQGAYDLPGPVIDSAPASRQSATVAGAAATTGWRQISASLFAWKLGPWLELPLGRRLWLGAGGGLALAYVESEFSFDETTTVRGVGGSYRTAAAGSDAGLQVGAYAQAGLGVRLSERWSLFALGEYQYLDEFTQEVAAHKATLDLGAVWSLQAGVGFSF